MEIMQGKTTRRMDAAEFGCLRAAYRDVLLDIGTGDGRFVLDAVHRSPHLLAIGLDACRENLRAAAARAENVAAGRTPKASRTSAGGAGATGGALFVIASANCLPHELRGLAGRVTINFPWGSLRDGLLEGELALLESLRTVMQPGARLEVRLNASALAEAGWELLPGGERVRQQLARAGFRPRPARLIDTAALRALPSTWARRLAFSRLPEAVYLES